MSDFLSLDVESIAAPDKEFEAARDAATKRVADAENDLLAVQLEAGPQNGPRRRVARRKVREAMTALQELEEIWLNEHTFDLITV